MKKPDVGAQVEAQVFASVFRWIFQTMDGVYIRCAAQEMIEASPGWQKQTPEGELLEYLASGGKP